VCQEKAVLLGYGLPCPCLCPCSILSSFLGHFGFGKKKQETQTERIKSSGESTQTGTKYADKILKIEAALRNTNRRRECEELQAQYTMESMAKEIEKLEADGLKKEGLIEECGGRVRGLEGDVATEKLRIEVLSKSYTTAWAKIASLKGKLQVAQAQQERVGISEAVAGVVNMTGVHSLMHLRAS
jgi:hypothetical protein